jgi:NitT/TauT family transport system substrate-binding protein
MNMRKFRAALVTAAATVSMVAGCSTAPGTATAQPDRDLSDVTVAALPAADLAGLYVALDDGLFAQQGLRVTIEAIPSSAAVVADQLRGRIDIGAGAYVPYIAAQAARARFRILAEADTMQPDTRALVVAAGSGATTLAGLVGKKIGVNGANSIGTLLISALLEEHGISPKQVDLVTDKEGFPAMPGQLRDGHWAAAFLAEPYITIAGVYYGEQVLADFDQGSLGDLPIDGYIATQAWAQAHPSTAAAFVRAIQEGQALAASDRAAVEAATGKYDKLPRVVTANMALPEYPTGPVIKTQIQHEADIMLKLGMLGGQYTTKVEQGTLVRSVLGPDS